MAFSPDLFMAMHGLPPPQAVLDKRPTWYVLIALLGLTFGLRMAALDIMGGLLCGLLLILACLMIRDGMRELPKFSLIFGVLCGVNFFFYILPVLLSVVEGRSERHIDPVRHKSHSGVQQLTYTLTVKTTPFFDAHAGLLYNVQSLGMLTMLVCMFLGFYLGLVCHREIASASSGFLSADDVEGGSESARAAPNGQGVSPQAHNVAAAMQAARQGVLYGAAVGRGGGVPPGLVLSPGLDESGARRWIAQQHAFQGKGHKLVN